MPKQTDIGEWHFFIFALFYSDGPLLNRQLAVGLSKLFFENTRIL